MARKSVPDNLAAELRRSIEASGLSLNQIGQRAGMDHSRLSRFMRGERGLTLDAVERIGEVLGLRLTLSDGEPAAEAPAADAPTEPKPAGRPRKKAPAAEAPAPEPPPAATSSPAAPKQRGRGKPPAKGPRGKAADARPEEAPAKKGRKKGGE